MMFNKITLILLAVFFGITGCGREGNEEVVEFVGRWGTISPINVTPHHGTTGFSLIWTGSEVIAWGGMIIITGVGGIPVPYGTRYNPATDQWFKMNAEEIPDKGRAGHSALWTGKEMIVWGGDWFGEQNTGWKYNPDTDTWSQITTKGAPEPIYDHTIVWTGNEMIVFGGINATNFEYINTGYKYDPVIDTWQKLNSNGAPKTKHGHTVIWTGTEMIIWGGFQSSGEQMVFPLSNSGSRYNPSTDSWQPVSIEGAPKARERHSAVWTGTEMIIWGGLDGYSEINTGGRYNPAEDKWMTVTTKNAPEGRFDHIAVWTGKKMIVWGGFNGEVGFNTGGLYDPDNDSWVYTTLQGAPPSLSSNIYTQDYYNRGVWTGTEMIVLFNSEGWRYIPY